MGGPRKHRTPEEQVAFELDKELTKQMKVMLPDVLHRAHDLLGDAIRDVNSLHGKIGGKNNEYANVADEHFQDYKMFQRYWLSGMIKAFEASGSHCAVWDIMRLYKDELCKKYILLFQERNFYRHYNERIRKKPDSQLWSVWFGGALNYGLLIAPARTPKGDWRIDHSEIRRVRYHYWTIEHIFSAGGFLNSANDKFYPISNLDELDTFYTNVMGLLANSTYERPIYEKYMEYLRNSEDYLREPFLIPEFHYEGNSKKCKYRLDFTVLNPYTFEFTGFEFSPSSTHMHVEKSKDKTQKQLNEELANQWQKECNKRNEYFQKYNISCVTFADNDLQDIDGCFNTIAGYLKKRNNDIPSMDDMMKYLDSVEI